MTIYHNEPNCPELINGEPHLHRMTAVQDFVTCGFCRGITVASTTEPQAPPLDAAPKETCRCEFCESRRNGDGFTQPLLSSIEQQIINAAGDLWTMMCAAIPEGPTRQSDLGELIVHIHAIQHTFMAQAASRAYPDLYRQLGSTL